MGLGVRGRLRDSTLIQVAWPAGQCREGVVGQPRGSASGEWHPPSLALLEPLVAVPARCRP